MQATRRSRISLPFCVHNMLFFRPLASVDDIWAACQSIVSSPDAERSYCVVFVLQNRFFRNTLEALVWEKEAEVDRFRDRWPMSMLVSRARMFNLDEKNKPRDVLAALNGGKGEGGVAILAEVSKVWTLDSF